MMNVLRMNTEFLPVRAERTKHVVATLSVLLMLILQGNIHVMAQDSTPVATPAFEEDRAITFYPEESGEGTFITVEINPGQSAEVQVILGNSGNVEQSIRTYSAPATSAMNGGFVLLDYGTEPDEITQWLDYPEQVFTFDPTEGMRVPLNISVPSDIAPGEYVTGIAAEQADAYAVPGTDMFLQKTRWAIPVLIVVPGDREPAFELTDAGLEWYEGSLYGTVGIENTGNVTVRPMGEVRLLDSEGTVVGVAGVEMQSVYSGTGTTFVVAWPLPASSDDGYTLDMVLTAEEGSVEVQQTFEGVVPVDDEATEIVQREPLRFSEAALIPLTRDEPPSMLQFNGEIVNEGVAIESARVSIVTYQDGEEVDRYPIMQAVTIQTGDTPVEARYSLPGGFTDGTYTFEVTIELGSGSTQTVLVTQPIDFEVSVDD